MLNPLYNPYIEKESRKLLSLINEFTFFVDLDVFSCYWRSTSNIKQNLQPGNSVFLVWKQKEIEYTHLVYGLSYRNRNMDAS